MEATVELVGGGTLGLRLTDEWDCNIYAVRGRDRTVLVDSGAGRSAFEPPPEADTVLLTHLHVDHAGGAAGLAQRGLIVLAHPWAADGLASGDEQRAGLSAAREWGLYPPDAHLMACPSVEAIIDGAVLELGGCTVTAVETPGHSDGHLAFVVEDEENRRILLSGDLVFADGRVVLQPLPDCRVDLLWRSIQRIRSYEPEALYAGHGSPADADAVRHLDRALAAFARGSVPPQLQWDFDGGNGSQNSVEAGSSG